MLKIATSTLFLCTTLLPAQANPSDTIGGIDFYNYQGLDIAKIRAALPVQPGSRQNPQLFPNPATLATPPPAQGKL